MAMLDAPHIKFEPLPHELEIDGHEGIRREELLEFRNEDADTSRDLREVAKKYANPVIEGPGVRRLGRYTVRGNDASMAVRST